eukprot:CAMPEP_0114562612 /NCGR_PEP_ID=MMETSP0114-20121206/12628_1 /TAXON_ID=31324 /ORGANISM="Goniomonas sp, Strain m" /LENGTH=102 /DNA_ID=CAMNT_0001748321 /DNA_START=65 /DNA_END=373 /DNA_ORIENTATION=+
MRSTKANPPPELSGRPHRRRGRGVSSLKGQPTNNPHHRTGTANWRKPLPAVLATPVVATQWTVPQPCHTPEDMSPNQNGAAQPKACVKARDQFSQPGAEMVG